MWTACEGSEKSAFKRTLTLLSSGRFIRGNIEESVKDQEWFQSFGRS
jgi:hypothetical protein